MDRAAKLSVPGIDSVLAVLAVCAAYYGGAELGFHLTFSSVQTSIFWLPNATMFAVFLLAPPRRWWRYVLAVLPVHFAVEVHNGVPLAVIGVLFVTNVGDAALGATLTRALAAAARPRFSTFRRVAAFVGAAIISPFLVSFLDAAAKVIPGWSSDYWLVWHTRFRSNVLTNLIWVPPIVMLFGDARRWLRDGSRRRFVEAVVSVLGLLAVTEIVFRVRRFDEGPATALGYAPLPLFLWIAVRFGIRGVSASILPFTGLVIYHVANGRGPFAHYSPAVNLLALQLFLTFMSASLLLLAALIQEQRQVHRALGEREAQYRSIFDATGDGVLVIDMRGAMVAANFAFCDLTGYTLETLKAAPLGAIFHLNDLQPFDTYLARAGSDTMTEAGAMCVRRDGGMSQVQMHARHFSYAGSPHVLCVVRDVSRREHGYELVGKQVAERTRALSMLLRVSNDVASTLELQPLVRLVLEHIRVLLPHSDADLSVLEGKDLVFLGHHDSAPGRVHVPAFGWTVLNRSAPLLIDDLWGDSQIAESLRAATPAAVMALFGRARALLVVPLIAQDRMVGVLWISNPEPDRYTMSDAELAWTVAKQAAVAIANAQLYEKATELAAFNERQRLARELHDSVTQTLYASANIAALLPRTFDQNPIEGRRTLGHLQQMTRTALAEMRTLLMELRPSALLQNSLGELLCQLGESLRSRTDAPIGLQVGLIGDLPPLVHATFYRVAQEALTNVTKHASARAVRVMLSGSAEEAVTLSVSDDGRGFDTSEAVAGKLGIGIMRERAAMIGATFAIDSLPGRGTTVTLRWASVNFDQAGSLDQTGALETTPATAAAAEAAGGGEVAVPSKLPA
jgi:two-component system nitrate/nitrite sensor histidine kinase NarX